MTGTHPPTAPPGALLVADVARLLSEERRKTKPDAPDLKPATVLAWVKWSRTPGGRYYGNPVPEQAGYLGTSRQVIWWKSEQAKDWITWFNSRPGHGHGTGGRRAGSTVQVAKPAKRRARTGRSTTKP